MLFEDRMAQSARKYDLPSAQRHYVGERHLVEMARAASTPEDFAILGVGIVSLAFLPRVGEAALLSPSDIRGGGASPGGGGVVERLPDLSPRNYARWP